MVTLFKAKLHKTLVGRRKTPARPGGRSGGEDGGNFLSHTLFTLAFVFLTCTFAFGQFHNGSQMTFGKNRVQHLEFLWTFYRFKQFDIYFYNGGKNISIYTAKAAARHLEELEKVLDYQMDRRIQFIVFNKLSDQKQTNIGLMGDDQYNTGGVTRIVGTKVMLYFDGDHAHLESEIRAGIAQVLVNQMMYGGDLTDMLKSSTFLNLPEWYLNGLMSHLARGWDMEIDNRVKDGIISGRYKKFNRLTGEDAVFAGHSIWAYIADIYGEAVIPNILYMAKISRNIESGFLFVLGSSLKNLTYDWMSYYTDRYTNADKTRHLPESDRILKKTKQKFTYNRLKISPDGKYAAFVTNQMGKYKVWLHNFETGKTKKIFRKGYKLEEYRVDYSFPLLAWHPAGDVLAMMREHKGRIILGYYRTDKKRSKWEENPFLHFEKVADFAYSQDGRKLVLSGVRDGQSDIFVHTISSHTNEQITKDIYDDLNPRFARNSSTIIFSSNRQNDTIRFEDDVELTARYKDIFVYDYASKSSVLRRITNTPNVNEMYPMEFDSTHYTYVSNANGINNRFLAHIDSVISHVDTVAHYRDVVTTFPVTNYSRNIVEHDISTRSGKYGEIIFADGRQQLFTGNLENMVREAGYKAGNTGLRRADNAGRPESDTTGSADTMWMYIEDEESPAPEVDINNYVFDAEPEEEEEEQGKEKKEVAEQDTTIAAADTAAVKKPFQLPIQRNYEVAFFVDQLISQLDNSFTNPNYQAFTGGGAVYFIPGPNAMFKFGISDVMEDYKVTGGFRLAGNFNSNEYFMSFQNLKRRLDKQIIFHRQAFLSSRGFSALKLHMHEISYKIKWPFNRVVSARLTGIYRNDRTAFLSTDLLNLQEPNISVSRGGLRGELVFDNTRSKGLNLYHGTRWKVFAEYFNDLDIMGSVKDKLIARLNPTEGRLFVMGLDYRNYMKVHREIIWANRFAASTSFGTQKLIYYMGGVDNWLFPKFDESVQIDFTQNYVFQAVATNMRGFSQNIRNGKSFAVINSELRIPIFRYLINRPLKSDFLYNFQIVAFGDVGTAWTGSTPYSSENSLNTKTVINGPVKVTLTRQIEPLVAGYGAGLRARIWGYFLRTDWAWGIEDGEITDPIFYLSMSLDF